LTGDRDFGLQLLGHSLTTVEITYYLPDYPSLLQLFMWQQYDEAPEYPALRRFLTMWKRDIEAVLHSVRIANDRTMGPRVWRPTQEIMTLQ
jgi:uncharacterized protein Usg